MNFIQKDITSQRNNTSTTTSNSYSGGISGIMTNLGYLELIKATSNIDNGIILKDNDYAFGGVTGDTTTYLLHTSDNVNEG